MIYLHPPGTETELYTIHNLRFSCMLYLQVDPPFVESSFIKVVPVRSTPATLDMPCTVSGWKEDVSENKR